MPCEEWDNPEDTGPDSYECTICKSIEVDSEWIGPNGMYVANYSLERHPQIIPNLGMQSNGSYCHGCGRRLHGSETQLFFTFLTKKYGRIQ